MLKVLRRSLVGILATFASLSTNGALAANTPDENLVKAAFLYNFAQFVEWPEGDLSDPGAPVTLCVLAPESVAAAFLSLGGKTVKGRELLVRFVDPSDSLETCQLVFVSNDVSVSLDAVFAAADQAHILTVSDKSDFASDGGVIGLYKRRNKIRFEVNLEAARQAKLKISSQLLKLARIVNP